MESLKQIFLQGRESVKRKLKSNCCPGSAAKVKKAGIHKANITGTVGTSDEPLTSAIKDNPARIEDDVAEYVIIMLIFCSYLYL
jgi:hypothetical protein